MIPLGDILGTIKATLSQEERALISRAYDFSEKIHETQKRYSGEPYFIHPTETAKNLAELGMGPVTIAAGLLHDVIEDGHVPEIEIEKQFGKEILFLVEGVTKLGKIRYHGTERHNESLRKLFVAMSQDIRVLIIKLADRLHNMKTLQYVPKHKQIRIAQETLEIYAPIAYRLGIRKLQRDLENLSFPYVYPKEYKEIEEIVKKRQNEDIQRIEKFHKSIIKILTKEGLIKIRTDYRIKSLYSLYKKYLRKEKDFGKIYDVLAMRVMVQSVEDCYKALGIVHATWRPLPGRIKDYIAFPKPNGYRALHTTIFTGAGGIIEVHIKTEEMYRESEYGIASHLAYKKELGNQQGTVHSALMWIKNLLPSLFSLTNRIPANQSSVLIKEKDIPTWIKELAEYQTSLATNEESFIDSLKPDFFDERIFVFTPKGDVVDLPINSTPIDFAYMIHSDIGDHVARAKVNDKLVSFDTTLHNGDIV
ncbi:MAG: HD domain-containing protein, partial [Patescibacteria group bacterium]